MKENLERLLGVGKEDVREGISKLTGQRSVHHFVGSDLRNWEGLQLGLRSRFLLVPKNYLHPVGWAQHNVALHGLFI